MAWDTQATQVFLEKWGIQHKTGIPYNPKSQAIIERAHQTFKTWWNKQKRGSQETSPRNLTMLALYTYNFLNCDDNLKSPIDKHFIQNRPIGSYPLVLYKDPLEEGRWEGPAELLTWGRGYVCVSSLEGPLERLSKRVKPYHRKDYPTQGPPLLHWTPLIQASLSCVSPPWSGIPVSIPEQICIIACRVHPLPISKYRLISSSLSSTSSSVTSNALLNRKCSRPSMIIYNGLTLTTASMDWIYGSGSYQPLGASLSFSLFVFYDVYGGCFLETAFRNSK